MNPVAVQISSQETFVCKVHCREAEFSGELSAVTEAVSYKQNPSILGGNNADCAANQLSVWTWAPIEIFEFMSGEKDPFGKLEQALGKYKLTHRDADLPGGIFCGGWIGWFGYELGRYIEKIPATTKDDLGLALIRLGFYDKAICYDHAKKRWWMVALEIDGQGVEAKFADIGELLTKAENIEVLIAGKGNMEKISVDELGCNMKREYYMEALKRTRQYIYDGDVYQINFSQRFESDYTSAPVELYHWQNRYNPSPYAAYIAGEDFAIVSASPEMYITIAGSKISTKPIKGTRPRVSEEGAEAINKKYFSELAKSEKDQAELNMIIDLERNDLTRICRYGTIKVVQPRTIEAYPTVYHAVATVEGELYYPKNSCFASVFCDVLRGMFPGGSITGAPKIRSMEIIDELEPTERSVYTGSIGYIGVDGSASLNIAIRTVIIKDGIAFAQTGGGIVADSDPQDEWDETITKARALLAGIAAVEKKS